MPATKPNYTEIAATITQAKPKDANAVKRFLLESLLPLLPLLLPPIISRANARVKVYLRQTRDLLVASDLD